ncbi:MAG: hypothetical protein AAF552_14510, partial [Pseudomonadota bacterium]
MSKLAHPFTISRNRLSWLAALALASAGAAAGDLPVVSVTSVDAQLAEAGLDTGSFLVSRQGGDLSQELRVNWNQPKVDSPKSVRVTFPADWLASISA